MSILNFTYSELFNHHTTDAVNSKLPLLGSPLPICTITGAYLLLVLKVGPDFMKKRTPFDLKKLLMVYNFLQVVLNTLIGLFGLKLQLVHGAYDMACFKPLPDNHPQKALEMWLSYAFFLMKLVDLLDTVFFVLRKSSKQISFLHVYHHVLMINSVFGHMHFVGSGGQLYTVLVLNSFVHSFMYAYYLASALRSGSGSGSQELWWKKYITRIQLLQFVLVFISNFYPLCLNKHCSFSKWYIFNLSQSIVMIVLFGRFYYRSYKKNQSRIASKTK